MLATDFKVIDLEVTTFTQVILGGKKLSFRLGESSEKPAVVQELKESVPKSHSIRCQIKISSIEASDGDIVIKYWNIDEFEQMERIKISNNENDSFISAQSRFPSADKQVLIRAEVSGLKTKYFRSRITKVLSKSEAIAYLIDVGIETNISLDSVFDLEEKWAKVPPIIRTGLLHNSQLKFSFIKSITIENGKRLFLSFLRKFKRLKRP